MTDCSSLRIDGNKLFAMAFPSPEAKQRLAPSLRITKAEMAIQVYTSAYNLASSQRNPNEWLSSMKNKGLCCLRLAEYDEFQEAREEAHIRSIYCCAVESLSLALHHGMGVKDVSWCDELCEKLIVAIQSSVTYIVDKSTEWQHRCNFLENLEKDKNSDWFSFATAVLQKSVAEEMWKVVVRADEIGDWKQCLLMLHEMYNPLIRAEQATQRCSNVLSLVSDVKENIAALQKSTRMYFSRAESTQSITIARELKDSLLFDQEELNMDMAYIVVDKYTAAILAAKQFSDCICLESEALAASELGEVLERILKLPESAHRYFLHAIQLADTITHAHGSVFFGKEWYQIAKRSVERYRRLRAAYDEAEIAKQREPILLLLKPKLDEMNNEMNKFQSKAFKAIALINHLYAKIPPKCTHTVPNDLKDDDNDGIKKCILKAIRHYHTDKQFNKCEGMEWFVLCEEITKNLNSIYERYKDL